MDNKNNDFYLLGNYHLPNTKVWLDLNGYYNSSTNCLVVNLGHSEDKTFSQAVLYFDKDSQTFRGVWGKKHKPMCLYLMNRVE